VASSPAWRPELDAAEFDYALPEASIAQTPLARRSRCRLAVVDRDLGTVEHARFDGLGGFLRPGDLLVMNDSKVLPARVPCRRPSGGAVEVFLLDPLAAGGGLAAFLRPAGKIRFGERLSPALAPGSGTFTLVSRDPDGIFRLAWEGAGPLDEAVLRGMGLPPLPPYIHRDRLPERGRALRDSAAYQTVYAAQAGSVAAPTAGLHFNRGLLRRLSEQGVERTAVTLHVGAGTFQPVKTGRLEDHAIHAEHCRVPPQAARAIADCRGRGGRVVAVGTTALRCLESAAQEGGGFREDSFETRLYILPGYRFKAVDGLLTNFHQPRSTLLPLVAAFWEREALLKLYADCIGRGYRFLSYGDACLFL
jgi:S-adenosylmethionine:tRNA ribosyltransferase-isomerase